MKLVFNKLNQSYDKYVLYKYDKNKLETAMYDNLEQMKKECKIKTKEDLKDLKYTKVDISIVPIGESKNINELLKEEK